MPYLLNEDAALKAQLQGLTVTDTNAPTGRPVTVRFRLPETELADMVFPCIVINHERIATDSERESRGWGALPYVPEGYLTPDTWPGASSATGYDPSTSDLYTYTPIPVNIEYTVTVYSRKAQHNVSLVSQLAQWNRLPHRMGALGIPQDGTARRLDLLMGPEIQEVKDDQGKRVFRIVYSVRVSSELLQSDIETVTKVLATNLSLLYQTDSYAA